MSTTAYAVSIEETTVTIYEVFATDRKDAMAQAVRHHRNGTGHPTRRVIETNYLPAAPITPEPSGDDTTFSLDELAGALRSCGVHATIERTGGNVATIFARRGNAPTVVAGPGCWSPEGSTADPAEFNVGPADDDAAPVWSSSTNDAVGDVLKAILGQVGKL